MLGLARNATAEPLGEFPTPAGLAPAVRFWVDIFTRYTGEQAVIHDRLEPWIVYQVVSGAADDVAARVRVTEWHFRPGARTGHHRHEYAYVVVPLTTGSLTAISAAGETTNALRAGEPYYRDAGVEHDVRNANSFEFTFIEIELKEG